MPDEGQDAGPKQPAPAKGTSRTVSYPPDPHRTVPLTVLPVVGRTGSTRHCWEIIQSPDNDLHGHCEECYANFVQRDCWTLWALREAGHKPCCQKLPDCTKCPVLLQQVAPKRDETVRVRVQKPIKPPPPRSANTKQVCRYLDVVDVPVSPDSEQYISAVSRAVAARSSTFRCRLRGVHLDVNYVNDMCVSRHVQDCVFLDEQHPEVTVQDDGNGNGSGSHTARKLPHDPDEGDPTSGTLHVGRQDKA